MGIGSSYKRRQDEQRRTVVAVFLTALILCLLSYWWGGESVRTSEMGYKQQATEKQAALEKMEERITELQGQVQSAQIRYQQMEEKYTTEVPQGEFRKLTDLIKAQMDKGIKPERLAFIIESARPPRNCTEAQAKRFVVKTPVYNGPHGSVSFGGGSITVTGEGQSALGETGNPEAWYDPGKPARITFIEIGGKETVKEGLLPIQHSMIIGSREHRFTVSAGERSFIVVTSDSCDYP